MLFVNGTPKTELLSLTLQLGGIHAGRLHRIKHIQPNFDQFRYDRFDLAWPCPQNAYPIAGQL
jgi:hypothetical protein